MTFIRPWWSAACANMNFLCQGFRKLSSERHTDIQTEVETDRHKRNYYTHRFTGCINYDKVEPKCKWFSLVWWFATVEIKLQHMNIKATELQPDKRPPANTDHVTFIPSTTTQNSQSQNAMAVLLTQHKLQHTLPA